MIAQVTKFPPGYQVYSPTVPDVDFYLLGDMLQVGQILSAFYMRAPSYD